MTELQAQLADAHREAAHARHQLEQRLADAAHRADAARERADHLEQLAASRHDTIDALRAQLGARPTDDRWP